MCRNKRWLLRINKNDTNQASKSFVFNVSININVFEKDANNVQLQFTCTVTSNYNHVHISVLLLAMTLNKRFVRRNGIFIPWFILFRTLKRASVPIQLKQL